MMKIRLRLMMYPMHPSDDNAPSGAVFKPHQIETAARLVEHLQETGFCYLAGEPRTGKTRTALKAISDAGYTKPLVLTKKNAIAGWCSEMSAVGVGAFVTNYEQAPKLSSDDFDIVILDEAHNLGSRGKPSKRFKAIQAIAWNKPLLCLSGTPVVETPLAIYHQTAISRYGPFSQFNTFYQFFRGYGVPSPIFLGGRMVESYTRIKPELLDVISNHTVTLTQDDAGITHQARDHEHLVSLTPSTLALIKSALRDSVININGREIILESDMAVRAAVHQIETGALLVDDEIVELDNSEVLEYCLQRFAPDETAIMAHYRSTRQKFDAFYPSIYSSNAHAEGVDLSHYKHFVIVNGDYSGAKFVQRRERITNMNVKSERVVHHITTNGLSKDIYEAVSRKRDFNLGSFRQFAQQHRRR